MKINATMVCAECGSRPSSGVYWQMWSGIWWALMAGDTTHGGSAAPRLLCRPCREK